MATISVLGWGEPDSTAGQPGEMPAAGAAGMGFGRMRSLVRLCANTRLPLPSSLPGRGQSCLQPHNMGGARGEPQLLPEHPGEGECGEEGMHGHTQPARGVYSNAESPSIRNLA